MVTVEVSTQLTMDDLIAAVDKLPNQALTEFARRVVALQTRRGLPLLETEEEQTLLQVIEEQHLADFDRKRLAWLREKGRDGNLTAEEHAELLAYVQRVENQDLVRIEALVKLSHKRGMTLDELMKQLGIEPNYA